MKTPGQPLLGALGREFERVYLEVCAQGYKALERTRANHPATRDNPWQHRPAWPPSYEAYGRYRFPLARSALAPLYLALDRWVRRLGPAARTRLCTQLLVTAQVP
ncbi:MAG TPA: hypothetical protein VF794_09035 [Archangium sp.]|uniref:hypothetical protein n=1 Tax=Archangium sp. TaxID=1872627 RepID=UPI002ED853CE